MFNIIIRDITIYLIEYIDNALKIAFIVAFLKVVICSIVQTKKLVNYQNNILRHCITLLMDFSAVFYVFMVIVITFISRMEGSTNVVNLRLFSTFGADIQSMTFIVENIIMFIPYGVFLWGYGIKHFPVCLALLLVSSTMIEALQYVTGRGRTEVDDILTNTIGGCVGFIATKLLFMIKYKILESRE